MSLANTQVIGDLHLSRGDPNYLVGKTT